MPTGIYKHKSCSKKTKEKISLANTGKKRSFLMKQNISNGRKGKNSGKEHYIKLSKKFKGEGNPFYKKKHSKISRIKMSEWHTGKKKPWVKSPTKGKKLTISHRKHISEKHLQNREKYPNWKGGVYPIHLRIRDSLKYKLWRESVFRINNWSCQNCNKKGYVEIHHKKSFSSILEELKKGEGIENLYEKAMNYVPLWDIENGQCLCEGCHKKTDTYGKNTYNKPCLVTMV